MYMYVCRSIYWSFFYVEVKLRDKIFGHDFFGLSPLKGLISKSILKMVHMYVRFVKLESI